MRMRTWKMLEAFNFQKPWRTNQASTNGSHDNEQNQVASTSSQSNDQASASNLVLILQPTNIVRDHPLDTIIGDFF